VRRNLLFHYLQVTAPEAVVANPAARGFPSKDELTLKVLANWGAASGGASGGAVGDGDDDDDDGDDDGDYNDDDDDDDDDDGDGGGGGVPPSGDDGGGAMVRMEDVIPAQVWAQIVGLVHGDWTTDEVRCCAALVLTHA
jgi:hypothetical protein